MAHDLCKFRADGGDIGSHIIDLARYLVGEIEAVNALVHTYITERPEQTGAFDKLGSGERRANAPKRPVDVDDESLVLLRFAGGATGAIGATRNAYSRNNDLGLEPHGSAGSIIT